MSKKPVEVPNIGFNEALNRIAKFNKEKLPANLKQEKHEDNSPITHPKSNQIPKL